MKKRGNFVQGDVIGAVSEGENIVDIMNVVGYDVVTLEKSFIVFRLNSFARNLRNELKTSRKVYFLDLGIRNAIIGNLSQVESRTDADNLWENFVIAERLKRKVVTLKNVEEFLLE